MENLDLLMPVVTAVLAILCAYNAGKLRAAMDIDQVEGRPANRLYLALWIFDLAFAVYFVIALYGHGLERGGV